jgi:hypothetical protein
MLDRAITLSIPTGSGIAETWPDLHGGPSVEDWTSTGDHYEEGAVPEAH